MYSRSDFEKLKELLARYRSKRERRSNAVLH
jgi:hypothetical protein